MTHNIRSKMVSKSRNLDFDHPNPYSKNEKCEIVFIVEQAPTLLTLNYIW
jgi:hypothetical protein